MPTRLPSFQTLVAFDAVAKHRSFTKAADELCITHGAISHRIRALEEHIGVRLLWRGSHRVDLTPEGFVLLEKIRKALADLDEACAPRGNIGKRNLKLSVLPAFASQWLLGRLATFRELHPDINLEVSTSYELANFKSDAVDLAVRYGAGQWPGLQCTPFLTDDLFPVCKLSYAESCNGLRVPHDLSRAVLLRCPRQPWEPWFRAAKLPWKEPQHGPVFNEYGLLLEATVIGQGVALARSTLVESALVTGQLIRLFDVSIRSNFAYYLVYPPEKGSHAPVATFIDWLQSITRADNSQ